MKSALADKLCQYVDSHRSSTPDLDANASMLQHSIVPDILDTAPSNLLEIQYDGGLDVSAGNEFVPKQVKDSPIITWKTDTNCLYTLIMTDPDAPSRDAPVDREFRHWLVINITGNNVRNGQVLVDYRGSAPPKDSGLHRYVYLLFPQRKYVDSTMFIPSGMVTGRQKTSTRKLMKEFDLMDPVAGNFFLAQYQD